MVLGMVPVRLFVEMDKTLKWVILPTSGGMVPSMRLWFKCKISNIVKLDNDFGIKPPKLLFPRYKYWSEDKPPIHAEIFPLSSL